MALLRLKFVKKILICYSLTLIYLLPASAGRLLRVMIALGCFCVFHFTVYAYTLETAIIHVF